LDKVVTIKSAAIAAVVGALVSLAITWILGSLFAYPGGMVMWGLLFIVFFYPISTVTYVLLGKREDKSFGKTFSSGGVPDK
jgi:ABC-type multidrug transport system permease subunit